jgi:hypothetical protein
MPIVDYYEHLKSFKSVLELPTRDDLLATSIIKFGNWILKLEGDLINEVDLYTITSSELDQPHWISHMKSKKWIDMRTFMDAYWFALSRKGISKLTVDVELW